MTYRSNSRRSLASTTWDDYHKPPAPKLVEPENPKPIEVINFSVKESDTLEIVYYRDGILKEQFESIDFTELQKWAIANKEVHAVYELPYYDQENDEDYLVIYPATSESGTAEEINQNRFRRWLKELTDEGVERILKHWQKTKYYNKKSA